MQFINCGSAIGKRYPRPQTKSTATSAAAVKTPSLSTYIRQSFPSRRVSVSRQPRFFQHSREHTCEKRKYNVTACLHRPLKHLSSQTAILLPNTQAPGNQLTWQPLRRLCGEELRTPTADPRRPRHSGCTGGRTYDPASEQ